MKNKVIIIILLLIILGFVSYSLYLVHQEHNFISSPEQKVIIAYNNTYLKKAGFILDAYKSVFEEEGIPWEAVEISRLTTTPAKKLAQTKPAIIFPDGLLQSMPDATRTWAKEYLASEGSIAVIYDAGIKTPKGHYREKALLSDIVGVNYIAYSKFKENAYTKGRIEFKSKEKADFFQMPPGKTDDNNILSGYIYGNLQYSVARTELIQPMSEENIFAEAVTAEGERYQAIAIKKYGRGNVLYVNLPLGYLKAFSDDLPLRAILRTFLFQVVGIPHLINTENGIGGLTINWHIDSNIEWANIPEAIKGKIFDKELRYSIHITTGNFRDQEGDGLGFDACGKGREFTQMLRPYGRIGSHGGWAHNWFAENLEKNKFSAEEIELYINKNKTCLESITGYSLLEYSAPDGVHPQPATTKILEKLGFNSYYYTGDSGSSPNRTFSNSLMVSSNILAFPVMTYEQYASLYEMKEGGIEENKVQKWLFGLLDYATANRTTRLFYLHLHDVDDYPESINKFLQYAKKLQAEGKLQIEPMSVFADFLKRFLKTDFSFRKDKDGLSIILENTDGLKGITVAVPRKKYLSMVNSGIIVTEDNDYYYLTINDDVQEKTIIVNSI